MNKARRQNKSDKHHNILLLNGSISTKIKKKTTDVIHLLVSSAYAYKNQNIIYADKNKSDEKENTGHFPNVSKF